MSISKGIKTNRDRIYDKDKDNIKDKIEKKGVKDINNVEIRTLDKNITQDNIVVSNLDTIIDKSDNNTVEDLSEKHKKYNKDSNNKEEGINTGIDRSITSNNLVKHKKELLDDTYIVIDKNIKMRFFVSSNIFTTVYSFLADIPDTDIKDYLIYIQNIYKILDIDFSFIGYGPKQNRINLSSAISHLIIYMNEALD